MKKYAMFFTAVLCAAAAPAFGGGSKHMDMDMKTMDANSDGMVSKDEFMRFHEMKWDKMKKNSSGMVAMKDMDMMHGKMMKDDKMMKDHKMMDDKSAKDKAK